MVDPPHYTAMDGAFLGVFFISYGILALVQLNNLYNGRFVLFAVLTACTGTAILAFSLIGFADFCKEPRSAIICGGAGRGLVALAMVWLYVSGTMLALFWLMRVIRAVRER